MGCFDSQPQVTEEKLPKWMEGVASDTTKAAQQAGSQPYTLYGFPRIADFNDDQTGAMDMLRTYVTGQMGGGGSLPRLIDPIGGADGTVENYMNPHVEAMLEPVIRNINLSTSRNLQGVDASKHMDGAFGDDRHKIQRAETMERGTRAIGDATGSAYGQAYDKAQSLRDRDIERLRSEPDRIMSMIDAMFKMGSKGQALDQAGLDLLRGDFEGQRDASWTNIERILKVLGGMPHGGSTTTPGPSTAAQVGGIASSLASLMFL